MGVLSEANCRDINDLVLYLASCVRMQEVEHSRSDRQLDFIKVAWNEAFKGKFQKEYKIVLKSNSGHPQDCLQYSRLGKGEVSKVEDWQQLKNLIVQQLQEKYYISDFVLEEIMRVLKVLEWSGGHYYLTG